MKKYILFLSLLSVTFFAYAQNVGIGTSTPLQKLHVEGTTFLNGNVGIGIAIPLARLHVNDSSVLFAATGDIPVLPGLIPLNGAGRRLMWYPDLAAFRVGFVTYDQWNQNNIGKYSFAAGNSTIASGNNSTAMGFMTGAFGNNSTALGNTTTASGFSSTALGGSSISSGSISTAMGTNTEASGYASTAMGETTIASGTVATAIGGATKASGNYSTAMGYAGEANAEYSIAIGEYVKANAWNSISFGSYNDPILSSPTSSWILTEPLLIVGNGTSFFDKKNALVILKNGNTGIGINNPNAPLAFANTTGKKISLYESSANSQYGFAVQGGQLQLYSDAAAAKISFGYYTSDVYTERMYLNNSTGILTVAGTNYPSDARYKKQITPLQNPLDKIMAINGVEYFMRTDEFPAKHFDTGLQVGLIAQEVEKVLPQVVQTGTDGYKAIDYARVVPLLVEGIKEQQRQIDELKKMVERLLK